MDANAYYGWESLIRREQYGEVDRLEDEAIVTEFFCFVLPVWPLRSLYVHGHGDEAREDEIPLHAGSVALGYLRVWTWFAAAVVASPALFAPARFLWLLPIALCLVGVGAVSTWVLGRLSPAECERRALLRRAIGVGAPPEVLAPEDAARTREWLEARWANDSHLSWSDAIARSIPSELLVAVAEFNHRPDLAADARAALAADRHHYN